MRINIIATQWQPKGPPPAKIDKDSRLLLYQERIANKDRNFKSEDFVFTPRSKFAR